MNMKASDLRKLIGQEVRVTPYHSGLTYTARILDVRGRNVLVDGGMTNWLWIPDCYFLPIPPQGDP